MLKTFTTPMERMPFNPPELSGKKRLAFSEFSFAEARAIRAALGGTVNDVVLATLGLAVRRYLREHGTRPSKRVFRVMAPVNMRHEDERGQLGNRVSILPVQLPLDRSRPVAFFRAVHAEVKALKDAHIADGLYLLLRMAHGAPPNVQALVGRAMQSRTIATVLDQLVSFPPIHTVCTNVPGPQVPLFAVGHRMLACYPFLPVINKVGASFGIVSYDQRLFMTTIADAAAMPDVDRMKRCLDEAFAELKAAAGVEDHPAIPLYRRRDRRPAVRRTRAKTAK
jgi:WS/DGAT/MGAT family acyltransferase